MKTDLRGLLDPFVPLPDVATLNTSTFHLTLLIDLLRTGRQAWLGAQVMTVKFDNKTLRGGGERERILAQLKLNITDTELIFLSYMDIMS